MTKRFIFDRVIYLLKYLAYWAKLLWWKAGRLPRRAKAAILIALLILLAAKPIGNFISKPRPLRLTAAPKDSTAIYSAKGKNIEIDIGDKEATGSPKIVARVSTDDFVSFTLTEATGSAKPDKKGNKVIYKDARKDIDLTYETLVNGIKEEIIVKKPQKGNAFTFHLETKGTVMKSLLTDFYLPVFYSPEGEYLYHIEKPFAVDANGNRNDDVILQIQKDDAEKVFARIIVDQGWLNSAAYPVTIDPTIVHDTTAEFATGTMNRVADVATGFITGATGGTITYSGGYTIHTFTSSGTFTPSVAGTVEYLVVGGGGGGGASYGAGGGAGGMLTGTLSVSATGYTVTVGAGGNGGGTNGHGSNGSDSILSTVTATGGGGGGYVSTPTGGNGGSGGGKSTGGAGSAGTGIAGQGYAGGAAAGANNGGGGGAGEAGDTDGSGYGGDGVASSISGSAVTYAGGGAGASAGAGSAGDGGGGDQSTNGTANTGGGGGGWSGAGVAGNGGSGIVIIRYPTIPNLGTTYQELPADQNTVGLWHMNESADNSCSGGQDACDSSGNGNHGTATGTTINTLTQRLGAAARTFNGTSDYFTVTDSNSLKPSKITIEAWIKTSASSVYVLSKYNGASPYQGYGLYVGPATYCWVGGSAWTSGVTTVTDNNWHHIACVYDGVNTSVYVDGKLDAVQAQTASLSYAINMTVGAYAGSSNFFNGNIDELRVSSIARTPEEIKLAAQRRPYSVYTSDVIDLTAVSGWTSLTWSELGVATGDGETLKDATSLVAQWNFNETSGTTATNNAGSCGASCNGTLTGFDSTASQDADPDSSWTANNRRWGVGALQFDGTDSFVSVTDGSAVRLSAPFTFESWINIENSTAEQGIISKHLATGGWLSYNFRTTTSGQILFAMQNDSQNQYPNWTTSQIMSPGQWYHVVTVLTGITGTSGDVKIYINGIESSTTYVANGYTSGFTLSYSTDPLTIGRKSSDSPTSYINGAMDSTRIYSRALTASEILSNYNSSNVEFQTRVGADTSPDDGSWEAWKPTTGETAIDSMDLSSEHWQVDNYQTSSSTVNKIGAINTGDGVDGDCIMDNGTKTLDSTAGSSVCNGSGRSTAYAVNFSVTGNTAAGSTSVTVSSTPTGLAAGDEFLIINLQGTSTNYDSVGKYEMHTISSISTNTLNFTDYPLLHTYDGTTQKIMVQRVPNFGNVTICGGATGGGCTAVATLTTTAWNGTKGGVLFFRSTGTVTVNSGGTVHTNELGFRGGYGGGNVTYARGGGVGESYCNNQDSTPNPNTDTGAGDGGTTQPGSVTAGACSGGGGGGADSRSPMATNGAAGASIGGGGGGGAGGMVYSPGPNAYGGGGGGGGYGTPGSYGSSQNNGTAGSSNTSGAGGNGYYSGSTAKGGGGGGGGTYGSTALARLYFGSAGAGGGGAHREADGVVGANGGNGGGIVLIAASTLTVNGTGVIKSNGGAGGNGSTSNSYAGSGGGGAGGSVYIMAGNPTLGTNLVTTSGGTGGSTNGTGGAGGGGVIRIDYTGSLSGATTPVAHTQKLQSTIKQEGSGAMQIQTGRPEVDSATVALWHLDETGGTGAYLKDSTANANHGTPTGTSVVNGVSGKARSFNGTSDKIATTLTGFTASTSTITVEFWAKIGTTSTSSIIQAVTDDTANRLNIHMPWTDNNVYWDLGNTSSGGRLSVAFNSAWYNQWMHWAFVSEAGAGQKIYRNGEQIASDGDVSTFTIGSKTLNIGLNGSAYWPGSLDEIRISNTARSAEEIAEAYRAGRDHYLNKTISSTDLSAKTSLPFYVAADRPGTYLSATVGESAFANYQPDANTKGLWHLDEQSGSGAYIKDGSGNGNHGTPTGTTFVQGNIGKARSFTGNDRIAVPNFLFYNYSQLTVSTWVKYSSSCPSNCGVFIEDQSDSSYRLWLGVNTGNQFVFSIGLTAGYKTVTNPVVLNDNKWHHLAGVYNSSSGITLYVDGNLVASDGTASSIASYTPGSTFIGTDVYSGVYYVFPGSIDEFRVDNVSRSADAIRQAYEIGKRTHPVTIDFGAKLDSGNLIANTSDVSFTVDATYYGLSSKGSNLYNGDKIIVRENVDGTEYIAQGTVTAVTASTGAVTVAAWDSGSTVPSGGFTVNASVFKWQREYWNIYNEALDSHIDAVTNLTLRLTDGAEGRTIWLDDLKSNSDYLTTPGGSTITSSTGNQYFQYRLIGTSNDEAVSASLTSATIDYSSLAPITPTIGTPTAQSTTSIRWAFTDNSNNEDGFKVYDSSNNLVATCATPNISYCDETGLSANTQYTRKVVAYRVVDSITYNSAYTATATIYTLANIPIAPAVSNRTATTIDVNPDPNSNPASTAMAIYKETGSTCDGSGGSYIAANGADNGATAVWQTDATWATATVTGLSSDQGYAFCIKARNGDNAETAFGPAGFYNVGFIPISGNYVYTSATANTSSFTTRYVDGSNASRYVLGVDNGATPNTAVFEVRSGALTINANDTLVVGSMTLTGGSVALATGGQIIVGQSLWAIDQDSDGHSLNRKLWYGNQPTNGRRKNLLITLVADDCNDTNPAITSTEGLPTWYQDLDGDTYGNSSVTQAACSAPSGYVANSTDCYDANPATTNAELAYPTSTNCQTAHRGDNSFDYNCVGGETKCGTTVVSNSPTSLTNWGCNMLGCVNLSSTPTYLEDVSCGNPGSSCGGWSNFASSCSGFGDSCYAPITSHCTNLGSSTTQACQ